MLAVLEEQEAPVQPQGEGMCLTRPYGDLLWEQVPVQTFLETVVLVLVVRVKPLQGESLSPFDAFAGFPRERHARFTSQYYASAAASIRMMQ